MQKNRTVSMCCEAKFKDRILAEKAAIKLQVATGLDHSFVYAGRNKLGWKECCACKRPCQIINNPVYGNN